VDIYFSVKNEKGEWGLPMNAGPIINTLYDDASPHLLNDVMYFSSNGQLLNYGDFDIYKSYLVDGKWTEPKNIGPLVNGPGQELYFSIDDNAKHLYYARSEMNDIKNLDLHSFPMPMEAKPEAIVRFTGKVEEPSTGEVFKGVVTVIDLKENIEVTPRHIRDDGTFEFDLINNRKYLLLVEGDNFFKIEETFTVNGSGEHTFEAQNIENVLAFTSIDFESGSAKLKPEMENNLHLLIEFLVLHPDYNLNIVGHTDNDGNPKANLKLSQERADNIKAYIVSYGRLEDWRVVSKGMGSLQPIIENPQNEDEKKINRRVEFKVFKNDNLENDLDKMKVQGGGTGEGIEGEDESGK
jgi:outer membrane protein OmpA-like peptidoglycan-associated protein